MELTAAGGGGAGHTAAQGPYGAAGVYGRSVAGRALHWFSLGRGRRRLLLTAALHANEWITAPLLMKFAHELASESGRACWTR